LSTKNASGAETALISQADERGYFGSYGGVFIAETDTLDMGSVKSRLQELRSVTELPLGVEFGIRDAELTNKFIGWSVK
jgi:tryptophan synthase alpha subunit